MAGHSKWANIKHKKAATDAKRSKAWGKLSKAIMVAAKHGGSELDTNVRLRTLVADARAVSMPKDNIERAIKKGSGALDSQAFEEIIYEGYGPSGVAVICDILTDNRNRTAPEIKKIFEKGGGKLGGTGCVAYLFDRKGLFVIPQSAVNEEQLMELALESGADDVSVAGDNFEIVCAPELYSPLSAALEQANIRCASKEVTRIPHTSIDLALDDARSMLGLMEELDDHDDVQNVSANFNIPDETMLALSSES
jgi:YebC/PmpR family DNA-binding regulatory protein